MMYSVFPVVWLLGLAVFPATAFPALTRNLDGEWGTPRSTITLPDDLPYKVNVTQNGLYLINLQDSFKAPKYNWNEIDRIYIRGGHYKFIRLGNLPDRSSTPDHPLIITNIGGQVRVGGLNMYYLFSISGGKNWILTGKYDPVSLTGDAAYPGHRGGLDGSTDYSNTRGAYGFLIDDDFYKFGFGNSGLGIGGAAPTNQPNPPTSDFEVSFMEIRNVGFAGMTIKRDDNATFPMDNVKIHDNYIHDTGSEGIYLGSTQLQNDQHSFNHLRITNNRVLRTGTEGIQVGQIGNDCEVSHNVVGPCAIDWKSAFQTSQDSCFQITYRYGQVSVNNNIFIGSANTLVSMFSVLAAGDPHTLGDELSIHNNYFDSSRFLGMYMGTRCMKQPGGNCPDLPASSLPNTVYSISNNTWRNFNFQRNEIYVNDQPNNDVVRVNMYFRNNITMENNVLDSPNMDNLMLTKYPYGAKLDGGINGKSGNITAAGNSRAPVPSVSFKNFMNGVPVDVDYLRFELWSATASLKNNEPIQYYAGDHVLHFGKLYYCNQDNISMEPGQPGSESIWSLMDTPVDDVRLSCDCVYHDMGLLDVAVC